MIDQRWTTDALTAEYAKIDGYARLHRLGHDVRGNLTNILGYVSLVRMALESNSFSQQESLEFLNTISEATQIIDSIVEAALRTSPQPA